MPSPNYDKPVDEDENVVKVNISPWMGMLGIALRQLSLIGGAAASIFGFLSAHDIKGLFAYFSTHEFLAAVCLFIGLSCIIYGHVREWFQKKKLFLISKLSPHQVKVEGTLPSQNS
jgi:hypothetical protein